MKNILIGLNAGIELTNETHQLVIINGETEIRKTMTSKEYDLISKIIMNVVDLTESTYENEIFQELSVKHILTGESSKSELNGIRQ